MNLLAGALVALSVICVKTSNGQNYVIEMETVIDLKAVQMYEREITGGLNAAQRRAQATNDLMIDFKYTISEVNRLLSTLSTVGLNLEVRVKAVNILNTNIFPNSNLQSGILIAGNTGLKLFSNWLTSQNATAHYNFDVALLLTGFDINGDTGTRTLGMAYMGTVCSGSKAVGIVEFNGTYITSPVIAHEILHTLGASHDGVASYRAMAMSFLPDSADRFHFGQCTAEDIKELLPRLPKNCLLETAASSTLYTTNWSAYTGKILNADVICQRYLNNTRSYTCMYSSLYGNSIPKGDEVCRRLYCSIPGGLYCKQAFSSEGLICDKNKRCNKGRCQPDSSPASGTVDPTCVLGDQKEVILTGPSPYVGSCPDIIAQRGPSICYIAAIAELCCATCNSKKTGIAGCEYGDKSSLCPADTHAACSGQNKATCCKTCHGHVGKRSTDEEIDFPIIKDNITGIVASGIRISNDAETLSDF